MDVEDTQACKKRCLDSLERPDPLDDTAPKNEPLPFTCICFDGKFYTTDNDGYFIHNVCKGNSSKLPLYRCEVNPQKDVIFTFIRNLSETEMLQIENIEDVNVLRDLSDRSSSLFY